MASLLIDTSVEIHAYFDAVGIYDASSVISGASDWNFIVKSFVITLWHDVQFWGEADDAYCFEGVSDISKGVLVWCLIGVSLACLLRW